MPFVGDANRVLVSLEGEGEAQDNGGNEEANENGEKPKKLEEDDDEMKKVPKKNFTELHRLSYVVRSIENDVQCVPRDSFRVTPEHELTPNGHFYGLDIHTARQPQNWQHFRSPTTAEARNNMESDDVVFGSGFLDTIESDSPQGSWSVQIDAKQKNVSLRSLKWPGYFCFHRLSSNLFGSAYIGDGSKNVDLAFMI
jgi:radial spoke head protein 9